MTNVSQVLPELGSSNLAVKSPEWHQILNLPQELLGSAVTVTALWLVYLLARMLINRHFKNLKERHAWRTRAFYVVLLLSFYFIGRIWINDPQNIITFLGIIAAALTLTQKETLMNLVGWVLIYWRDLFTTGDRVQVLNYYGEVAAMGIFYFNLIECNPNFKGNQSTGKLIRVPNGLIITNAVTNFSDVFPFNWNEFKAVITPESDVEKTCYILKGLIDQRIHQHYHQAKDFLTRYTKNNYITEQELYTQTFVNVKTTAPMGIEITVRYLGYPAEISKLESEIWLEFLRETKSIPSIKLALS